MRLLRRLWLIPVLLLAWELAARAVASPFAPPPTLILARGSELWFSGQALHHVVPSLARVVGAWAAAVLAGVSLGVAVGRTPWLADLVDPLVEFGRAVPPPAMLPVFLVLFQLGTQVQVATIVFGIIWPILLNAIDGARDVDPLQLDTAAVFGVRGAARLFLVILPAAAPKIFAGLRLSVSLALILMVISELKGSTEGIGHLLSVASNDADMPALWAAVVLLGVLGYTLNTLFLMAERRALAWHIRRRS